MTPTYWGEDLCRECGDLAVLTFDRIGWPRPWWEAPQVPYVGVLGGQGLLTQGGHRRLPMATLGELAGQLEALGIRQLWVHESAMNRLGLPDFHGRPHPFLDCPGYTTRGRAAGVLAPYQYYRKAAGVGFSLHIPRYEDSSPFAGTDDPYRLLCYIAQYEHATRGTARWMGGGQITSDRWLRERYRSPRRANLAVTEHPEPILNGRGLEEPFHWSRSPSTRADKEAQWCHALDINSAYAAVASSLALPVGPCFHLELPTFDKRIPGLWLIDTEAGGWDEAELRGVSALLPAPWEDRRRLGSRRPGPHWVATPIMERVDQAGGWPIEAWVWPEHRTYLRPWYEMLRDAQAELRGLGWEGGPPLEAVKEIGRRGIGRLGGRTRTRNPESDELYQPYWSSAVRAECRARLHRRLVHLELPAVAIDTDAVFFLSSVSSPEALAVRLGLPLGEGFGQFKAEGTCPGELAREILAGKHPVGRLAKACKGAL